MIFRVFRCHTMDSDEQWHTDDYSVSCTTGVYDTASLSAQLLIILYPVGVPAMLMFMLFTNRSRLRVPQDVAPRSKKYEPTWMDGDQEMYSFLVGDYREEVYWFEIYEIARKFVFVCIMLLVSRGSVTQVFAACCVSFCTFSVQMHVRPYKQSADNLLKACAEAQLFCTLLGTLVLRLENAVDAPTAGYDLVMTAVTLGVFPLTATVVIGRPALRNLKHFLSRGDEAERSSTPVMKFRGFDGQESDDGEDEAKTEEVAAPKRQRQADWKTVERGGALKWSKTYRVPRSNASSASGSARGVGHPGATMRRDSSRGSSSSSRGGSMKESVRRSASKAKANK